VFSEILNEPLSTAAIVGITVAASLVTIIATVLIVGIVIWRRKKRLIEIERLRREERKKRVKRVEQLERSPVRRTLAIARTIEEASIIEFDTREEMEASQNTRTSYEAQTTSDDSFVSVEVELDGTRSFFYEIEHATNDA
jgi:hypothetical protein